MFRQPKNAVGVSNRGKLKSRGRAIGIGLAVGAVIATAGFSAARQSESIVWTRNGAPITASIKNGPWTLEQSGAANGLKSSGYCDASLNPIGNPGTERMEPYYFPFIVGQGSNLQGYFDYRPKDTNEAVVAASSNDSGVTWNFQSQILDLNHAPGRTLCPTVVNPEPDGDVEAGADPNNSDSGDDDGQGHQFIINIGGKTLLYTLVRSAGHIDNDQLAIHELTPTAADPLHGAPLADDASTDTMAEPPLSEQTSGLLNPDGILGVVPESNPLEIIYEQKVLNGDLVSPFPATQQCNQTAGWKNYYKTNTAGIKTNDDVTFLRLASTTDGFHFTDLGALQGLNDPMTLSMTGTRWLATAGSVLKLAEGSYGLLFSGGNCIDGDSDAFHYIGYAESTDLIHWNVINGLNNPIASVFPATLGVDANNIPIVSGGTPLTIPSQEPVVGDTQGFFAGRIYAPSATQSDENNITVMFAGYHTAKPKNGLGDYRTIGRVSLHASGEITEIGANGRVHHSH
jgi:hypothetical protein